MPILQREMQAREEADAQATAGADIHPQSLRGGRFQPGFVGIGVHKKQQGERGQDQQANEPADGEQDDFK
jgi:hypothetical protein